MKSLDKQMSTQGHQEKTVPYHFSTLARALVQDLKVGDYVRLPGSSDKYELVAIFLRRESVRVRAIGCNDQLYLPMRHVRPWEEES